MDRRSSQSSHLTRQSTRSSSGNVFSDQYALTALDRERPQRSPTMSTGNRDYDITQDHGSWSRTGSIHDPAHHGSPTRTNSVEPPTVDPKLYHSRFSIARDRNSSDVASPATHRRSTFSSMRMSRAESPYQGATGPSQPYGMYAQNTALSRAASTATASTVRQPERSYVGPRGPTQPYGQYPQNTTTENEEDTPINASHVGVTAYPAGSRPPPRPYQRRLGPDGEDIDDIIGPDGYTEQLPPYTRYPNDIPPKRDPHVTRSFYAPPTHSHPSTSTETDTTPPAGNTNSPRPSVQIPNTTIHTAIQPLTPNPFHSPVNDSFGAESTPSNTTSTQVDSLPKEEDEGSPSRVQQKYRKRVCWGVIPCWALAVVVGFLVAVLLGGIIGGVLAHKDGVKKGVETAMHATASSSQSSAPISVVTTSILPGQTPDDAAPIATPADLPAIPTGTFAVALKEPLTATNSCLTNTGQNNAWDCSNGANLDIDIQMPFSGEDAPPIINLTYRNLPNQQIRYGAQPPELVGRTNLVLAKDKSPRAFNRGPAYSFSQEFNKTVIVKAEDFPGTILPNKRDTDWLLRRWLEDLGSIAGLSRREPQQSDWNQTYLAKPGDKPWYCYWNGTVFSGFIYVTDNTDEDDDDGGGSSTDGADPGRLSKRQQASTFPQYPKTIKIKEKRNPTNPIAPYCQQVQVLYDFRLSPPLNTVLLNEVETSPRKNGNAQRQSRVVRRDTVSGPRCECQWQNN